MAKFTVGDRVGVDFDNINDVAKRFGVITDVLSDGRVMVRWDDNYYNRPGSSTAAPLNPNDLLTEDDHNEKYNRLEKEFNKVADEVREQLKKAGELILTANDFAKNNGFESLQEFYGHDVLYTLENAMAKCGWQTSSLHC